MSLASSTTHLGTDYDHDLDDHMASQTLTCLLITTDNPTTMPTSAKSEPANIPPNPLSPRN